MACYYVIWRSNTGLTAARWVWHLGALLLVAGLAITTAAGATQNPEGVVREGVAIEFTLESLDPGRRSQNVLQEGDMAKFRFSFTDAATGAPLTGAYPGAWMDLRSKGEQTDDQLCTQKVQAFVAGTLLAPSWHNPNST